MATIGCIACEACNACNALFRENAIENVAYKMSTSSIKPEFANTWSRKTNICVRKLGQHLFR